jgi:hypothetical protein
LNSHLHTKARPLLSGLLCVWQDAKARFAAIVAQTVEKREAQFGFKLDADDIKEIEKVLRPKYCGPSGLIGPC